MSLFFTRADRFLATSSNHRAAAVWAAAVAGYLLFFGGKTYQPMQDWDMLIVPVFVGFFSVWLYISFRKYGFIPTLEFLLALMFYIPLTLASWVAGNHPESPRQEPEHPGLVDAWSRAVDNAINRIYTGKIIDKQEDVSGISVVVETPYGLRVPQQDILREAAVSLSLPVRYAVVSPVSARKTRYTILSAGIRQRSVNPSETMLWNSFPAVLDRLLLRFPPTGVSRTSRPASR